jgi:hypothetical protein
MVLRMHAGLTHEIMTPFLPVSRALSSGQAIACAAGVRFPDAG